MRARATRVRIFFYYLIRLFRLRCVTNVNISHLRHKIRVLHIVNITPITLSLRCSNR